MQVIQKTFRFEKRLKASLSLSWNRRLAVGCWSHVEVAKIFSMTSLRHPVYFKKSRTVHAMRILFWNTRVSDDVSSDLITLVTMIQPKKTLFAMAIEREKREIY